LEEPWATVTFADEHWQNDLAATIDERKLDLVVVGPVTCSGMDEAGTLQEVRDFVRLLKDVRARAHRPVAFLLVHHESKAGRVSGAWEGATDTLLHVASEGQARTRLYVQKARWASSYHALTLQLGWTDGDGFEIIDRPEVSDETIRASLLVAVRALPGASWSKIRDYRVDGEKIVRGNLQQVATVRDRLLAERALVNSAAQEGRFNLWLADDPAAPGSGAGTGPERPPFASTGEGDGPTRSPFPPYKGTGNGTERPSPVHLGDEWYQVALAEAGNAGHLTEREFDELLSLHRFVEEAAP
jgi:hypothetical protein